MNIISAKLTGNPGPSGWSQVHEFSPLEPEKLQKRGRLYAVVATGSEKTSGIDSVSAGRELITRLHEEYFGKLEGAGFNALKVATETVTKEFSESWGEVEIAAVCILGDVVYSVAAGGAQISIAREGALAKILTSNVGEVANASGYPKEGDFIIFGTKKFFEVIDSAALKEGLEAGSAALAAEVFAPSVHARNDSGNLGAIILQFKKGEEVSLPLTSSPVQTTVKEDIPKKDISGTEKQFHKSKIFLELGRFTRKLLSKLPDKKIYVKPDTTNDLSPDSRKTTLTVGAIMLALLVVSIIFGIRQKGVKEARGRYAERLTQAEHSYDESISLVELSPERSRELFLESKTLATSLESEGVKDKRLVTLLEKINSSQGSVLGEYGDPPELFLDLSLLTSGFNGSDLAASGTNLFVLDKDGRRVVRVAIDTKKTETVAGPDTITSAQRVAGYEDRAFVLGDTGVFEVGEVNGLVLEDTWEGEVLPHVFGANFYVLEKGAGIIWRYPGDGKTFGAKQNWLGEGVKPNFSGAVGMAIDGTILVLSDNGRIQKFSQGSPQNFTPQGVNPALTFAVAIYTNEENKYVYILDKVGKRVLVLEKDGKYKSQYVSDKIEEATDLAVSEKEGKIILLSGSRLYSLTIKHL